MASEAGKGSGRRPGTMQPGAWKAIDWGETPATPAPYCDLHKMSLSKCGCMPTDDGPGQEGAEESPASQAKTLYERRRFER
jgi:hypothetical protein